MSDQDNAVVEETENQVDETGLTPIKATCKGADGEKLESIFHYDFLESAADCIDQFGDACVHERFIRASKIEAQQRMRELLSAGKTADEVSDHMTNTWHPGASSQNPEIAVMNAFASMSAEEREALIAKLTSQS